MNAKIPVSGASSSLTALLDWCFQAAPWLSYTGERLAFAWTGAAAAYAAEHGVALDPRATLALADLLPQLPLSVFATNAPALNYFNEDERTAGLVLAAYPVDPAVQELLYGWSKAVAAFADVLQQERELADQQEGDAETSQTALYVHPYKDGQLQKTLQLAAAIAGMTAFQQTLNLRFDLTSRLSVAAGDMGHFLTDVQAYPYNRSVVRRQEIRHALQHLCRLRQDLLAQLVATDGPPEHLAATLASLARREQTLCKLLYTTAKEQSRAKSGLTLLTQRPGYGLALADGGVLPFDISPYATAGSMIRSYAEDFSDVPLPPQTKMLAAAIRYAVPDPYRLTMRHASAAGTAAARVFVAVTERLQAQLRRIDNDEESVEASVDPATLATAREVDSMLQWALGKAPLLTLLLSGFLATYRQGERWGFALSPWVVANTLSERVLKAAPLTFISGDAVAAPALGDDDERVEVEPESAQPQTTGQEIWDKFAAARS